MKKATQPKKKSKVLIAPFTTENEFRTLHKIGVYYAKLQAKRDKLKITDGRMMLIVKNRPGIRLRINPA